MISYLSQHTKIIQNDKRRSLSVRWSYGTVFSKVTKRRGEWSKTAWKLKRVRWYFFKKSSSTTAEMSRRGLPMPRRVPSDTIVMIWSNETRRSLLHAAEDTKQCLFIRYIYVLCPQVSTESEKLLVLNVCKILILINLTFLMMLFITILPIKITIQIFYFIF